MPTQPFPIDRIRAEFPALAIADDGRPRIYFDNPAGTQVPLRVIERTKQALIEANANLGGYFTTSEKAVAMVEAAHAAMADFYNAASPREIVFGQNMTTLTLHLSRCLARRFAPGDEIVLSRMDHDANVAPWLLVAEERDLVVRWLDFDPETCEFADGALDAVLSERTRLLAVGYASNFTGTINDVANLAAKARSAGAIVYVDAVQLAPHRGIDVQALGCDFLVASAYKFFGPHQGIVWGREERLAETFAYKVRAVGEELPHKFETGTLSHEGLAGTLGAVEYLASIGDTVADDHHRRRHDGMAPRARAVHAAFDALTEWETQLCRQLIAGLKTIKGLTIHGIASDNAMDRRVPTVSVTVAGRHPGALAKRLAADNIFVWSGHNYAIEPVKRLGLLDKGGVLRIGLAHYNTPAEVDALLASLDRLVKE